MKDFQKDYWEYISGFQEIFEKNPVNLKKYSFNIENEELSAILRIIRGLKYVRQLKG